MESNRKLEGKIALVTGGSSGLGLATAARFIAEGAYVFVTARERGPLEAAALGLGPHACPICADVTDSGALDDMAARIRRDKGRLDILFANAGLAEFAALGEISAAHFDRIFGTNVRGLLFSVQAVLPLMPDGASIVLNASMVSIKGNPAYSVYSASKAAVRALARSWILDLRKRRIRVNVVSAGTVPTPAYEHFGLSGEQMAAFISAQSESIPLGRVGTPQDIARAVLFLASEESSYINGVELFVDGGMAQI